jgi:tetratricopeptide (TPR) repeat protein
VQDLSPIDPDLFIDAVQPLLERQDVQGLCTLLKTRWSCEQLRELLHSERHLDATKVGLLAIALVGTPRVIPAIAIELRHADRCVNEMAEHALWSIWLRAGSDGANHDLLRGIQSIERGDYSHAIKHFDRAIEMCPDFAEAYNQRAIARYLGEEYEASILDCERAVELMPCHFGALSGLGHCHAHLGNVAKAICFYEKALEVNPHLDCVREAVEQLKKGQKPRKGKPARRKSA